MVGMTSYISFSNVSVPGFRATGFGSVAKAVLLDLCELISRSFSLFVAVRETALRIWTFPFIGTRSHIVCARVSGLLQVESILKGFCNALDLPQHYPCEGYSCLLPLIQESMDCIEQYVQEYARSCRQAHIRTMLLTSKCAIQLNRNMQIRSGALREGCRVWVEAYNTGRTLGLRYYVMRNKLSVMTCHSYYVVLEWSLIKKDMKTVSVTYWPMHCGAV